LGLRSGVQGFGFKVQGFRVRDGGRRRRGVDVVGPRPLPLRGGGEKTSAHGPPSLEKVLSLEDSMELELRETLEHSEG
jgi:hypothetical protein